ncbi:MAG: glycosyltransferase family 4 protein [Polyangiaceae bacterium]
MNASPWIYAGVAVAVAAAVRVFEDQAFRIGLLDKPNERSSHSRPTPRGGGLVFVVAWTLALFVQWALGALETREFAALAIGLLVAAVGLVDDLRGVPARVRIVIHLVAATAGVLALGDGCRLALGSGFVLFGIAAKALAVLGIVWSINLFNFMDGTDGIAGSEALFVLALGGAMLAGPLGTGPSTAAWTLAACQAGFLVRNWPKAKVFMGDVGSGFLGYTIAVFALLGERRGTPALTWAIPYGLFAFDATATLLRRMAAGEVWYSAHRSHAYQRLHHHAKWTHRRVLLGAWGVNVLLGAITYAAFRDPGHVPRMIGVAFVVLAAVYVAIEKVAPMRGDGTKRAQ